MALQHLPLHKSVLTEHVITYLNPQPGHLYVDATFGTGGHTQAILEREPRCNVIALDWDTQALQHYGQPLKERFGERLIIEWGNFAHLYKILKKLRVKKIDGIIADIGTSQVQIVQQAGFSVYRDTPLDMRMSPSHQRVTAAEVVNTSSEEMLRELFWQLGGETRARLLARAIVEQRKRRPFTTTKQLADLVADKVGAGGRRIHPATKLFQALRIYVNKELDNLHALLALTPTVLNHGGRVVIISFHSLEDKIVKQFFKEQEQTGIFTLVTQRAIKASVREIHENRSSRSARLRAAEMK